MVRGKGIDELTLEEAFVTILDHQSGYARGLGKGHIVITKGNKKGDMQIEARLHAEIHQLWEEMERLKAREAECKAGKEAREAEARAREAEWKAREEVREAKARAREVRLRESIEAGMQVKIQQLLSQMVSLSQFPNFSTPSCH